jgi:uncharacterized membrane protein YagU involved in acid resistance
MSLVEMIVSGVVATLFMDVWQRLVLPRLGVPPGNWGLVGRWFVQAGRGRIFHDSIAAAPEVPNETAIGWVGHYAVGILYGVVFVLLVRGWLGLEPSLLSGLVFGIASVVVPWLFFMPAMGNGVLGSRTPKPALACLLAFLAHSVFGVGLAVGAMAV